MLASYFLSRTVAPTMVKFLLKAHAHDRPQEKSSFFGRIHESFNDGFEALRIRYTEMLSWSLGHRRIVFVAMLAAVILTAI
jgi:multidrug efflux pump subunit AcrB